MIGDRVARNRNAALMVRMIVVDAAFFVVDPAIVVLSVLSVESVNPSLQEADVGAIAHTVFHDVVGGQDVVVHQVVAFVSDTVVSHSGTIGEEAVVDGARSEGGFFSGEGEDGFTGGQVDILDAEVADITTHISEHGVDVSILFHLATSDIEAVDEEVGAVQHTSESDDRIPEVSAHVEELVLRMLRIGAETVVVRTNSASDIDGVAFEVVVTVVDHPSEGGEVFIGSDLESAGVLAIAEPVGIVVAFVSPVILGDVSVNGHEVSFVIHTVERHREGVRIGRSDRVVDLHVIAIGNEVVSDDLERVEQGVLRQVDGEGHVILVLGVDVVGVTNGALLSTSEREALREVEVAFSLIIDIVMVQERGVEDRVAVVFLGVVGDPSVVVPVVGDPDPLFEGSFIQFVGDDFGQQFAVLNLSEGRISGVVDVDSQQFFSTIRQRVLAIVIDVLNITLGEVRIDSDVLELGHGGVAVVELGASLGVAVSKLRTGGLGISDTEVADKSV